MRYGFAAGILGILFSLSTPSFAQNVTGAIVGNIKDISGAAAPAASVTAINQNTNIEYKAVVSDSGEYTVSNLPSGNYTVRTQLEGFKPSIVRDVVLLPSRSTRVDVVLEPGAVNQAVEVTAAAPVLNTENATIGNIMQSGAITSVPLNGRFLDRLIRISAGVTTDSASNPRVAGSPYWGGIQFNVDGVGYNDPGNGGGAYSYRHGLSTQPSVDSISEFKMDSNNMKAEYESAVSVTVVTKSGTNEIHGAAWEFNRNRAYAAKNAYLTGQPKPPFNRNEFGGNIGGPIRKNKWFFFGSYEDLLERSSLTTSGISLPTEAMRNGNFAGLATLLDPLSGTPFANNVIPASRVDSRASALQSRYPLPNLPGSSNGTLLNYATSVSNKYNVYRFGVRSDYKITDKDTFFVNLNYSKGDPYFVAQNYPTGYGSWENGGYMTKSLNATYQRMFSPTVINELRFGLLSHTGVRQGMNKSFDPRSLFPTLYPVDYGGLPNVNITSYTSIGDYGGSNGSPQITPQLIDNLTMIRGKHTIKTGFDFADYRVASNPAVGGMGSGLVNNAGLGRFDFTGRYTSAAASALPANAYADFLLGYANTTYRSSGSPALVFSSARYSAFVQDDIQVNSRLSLSIGLRYMLQIPWSERSGIMSQFDNATSKLYIPGDKFPPFTQQALLNAYPIVLGKDIGQTDAFITDKNNLGVRFGLAYRPFQNNKTVLRAGFGEYYNFLPVFIGFRQLGFSNPPFLLAETFASVAGSTPNLTLANPFPGGGKLSPNPSINIVQRNIRNAESYQWNLTVEREVRRNLGLRASYIGNHSTHVPWYNYSLNVSKQQIPDILQPYRPYQPWADILALAGGGNSIMHQLQLEAVQRYHNGLTFQVEYAWTRSLDDVPVVGGPVNDPYNARAERGNSDQMRRHVLSAAYSYELPFGTGKALLNNMGRIGDLLVGGWALGGITYLRTGGPFSLTYTATATGWRGGRPDAVCDGTLHGADRGTQGWFNTACYKTPTPFTYGNMARNALFGPGDIVFDVNILKNVKVTERVSAQLRGEFFNFPNHVNLSGPATNISNTTTIGKITSAGDPRQVQFGLKLLF
ncbi:MAG: carboxypeptidase-like regulatory domain-containing protein [Bryobacterales bacterium]|nr:carboxypeptidase-like regulatory domain-containing protein [Bryobacterales bacterium]